MHYTDGQIAAKTPIEENIENKELMNFGLFLI